jgi:RHS repeat-associated protein
VGINTKTVDASANGGTGLTGPVITQRYVLDNHLGSASLELDESASIISYEEYYPYGSTSYQAGASVSEVKRKRYRYTGKEKDEESGLYYHGARYYACWLGRWTASDPIGVGDVVNLYMYVSGNPVRLVDPSGTREEGVDLGILENVDIKATSNSSLSIQQGQANGSWGNSETIPVDDRSNNKNTLASPPDKTQAEMNQLAEKFKKAFNAVDSELRSLILKMIEHHLSMEEPFELTWLPSSNDDSLSIMYEGFKRLDNGKERHTMGKQFANILKERYAEYNINKEVENFEFMFLVIHLHPVKPDRENTPTTMFSFGDQSNMQLGAIWIGIELLENNEGVKAELHVSTRHWNFETNMMQSPYLDKRKVVVPSIRFEIILPKEIKPKQHDINIQKMHK